jgi:hypothetical protein
VGTAGCGLRQGAVLVFAKCLLCWGRPLAPGVRHRRPSGFRPGDRVEGTKAGRAPDGLTPAGGELLARPCVFSYMKGCGACQCLACRGEGLSGGAAPGHQGALRPFFKAGPPLVLRFQGRIQSLRGSHFSQKGVVQKTRKGSVRKKTRENGT